jgi:hypothetical protein
MLSQRSDANSARSKFGRTLHAGASRSVGARLQWQRRQIDRLAATDGAGDARAQFDLGYISFDSGGVRGKALEILRELVGLGLTKVQAAD